VGYKNWCLDALEGSFALNLIILVGATFYVKHTGGNQLAVGTTSASIAFATFTMILAFQLLNVTGIIQYLKTIRKEPQDEEEPLLSDRLRNRQKYDETISHSTELTEELVNETY